MTTIDTNALWFLGASLFWIGLVCGFKWGFSRGLFKGLHATRPNLRTPWNVQGKG